MSCKAFFALIAMLSGLQFVTALSAAAAPKALSCGPWPVDGKPVPDRAMVFIIDADNDSGSAILLGKDGSENRISISASEHRIVLGFDSYEYFGSLTRYRVEINRHNLQADLKLDNVGRLLGVQTCVPAEKKV